MSGIRPHFTSMTERRASGVTMRRSAPSAICRPPPIRDAVYGRDHRHRQLLPDPGGELRAVGAARRALEQLRIGAAAALTRAGRPSPRSSPCRGRRRTRGPRPRAPPRARSVVRASARPASTSASNIARSIAFILSARIMRTSATPSLKSILTRSTRSALLCAGCGERPCYACARGETRSTDRESRESVRLEGRVERRALRPGAGSRGARALRTARRCATRRPRSPRCAALLATPVARVRIDLAQAALARQRAAPRSCSSCATSCARAGPRPSSTARRAACSAILELVANEPARARGARRTANAGRHRAGRSRVGRAARCSRARCSTSPAARWSRAARALRDPRSDPVAHHGLAHGAHRRGRAADHRADHLPGRAGHAPSRPRSRCTSTAPTSSSRTASRSASRASSGR